MLGRSAGLAGMGWRKRKIANEFANPAYAGAYSGALRITYWKYSTL
jgi:hypothetical protein